ncbi:MAG: hypothetical protein ACI9LA_002275, partial [Bacteroidia bacterium]
RYNLPTIGRAVRCIFFFLPFKNLRVLEKGCRFHP